MNMAVTEHLASEILSLPMYPELSQVDIDKVILSIKNFYTNSKIL
jgi:dTDP-4-amino-4,6-dideoxygalactose transaminase